MKIEINKTYRHLLTPNQIWEITKIENDKISATIIHDMDSVANIRSVFQGRKENFHKNLFPSIFEEFSLPCSLLQKFINFFKK